MHFFWPPPPGVVSVALSDLCIEEVLAGVALDQVVQAPLDDAERIGKFSGRPVPRLEFKHSPRQNIDRESLRKIELKWFYTLYSPKYSMGPKSSLEKHENKVRVFNWKLSRFLRLFQKYKVTFFEL